MRILYTSTAYPPSIGGAQRHLHALVSRVGDAGHQPKVAIHTQRYRRDYLRTSTIGVEPPGTERYEGIELHRIGLPWLGRWRLVPAFLTYYPTLGATLPWGIAQWRAQIDALGTDSDIVHAVRVGREFIYQAALDVARRRGLPFVLTPCHHPRWKGPLYRQWDRIYREADAVIALTDAEREILTGEKGVPEDRVHVTGVGPLLTEDASPEDFRERYGIDGRFVLFLGQQLRYKGIEAVVSASRALAADFPDVRYVFVGPRTRWSKRYFRKLDGGARVVELGPLGQADKTAALMACELLCLPSAQESFGGVFVEAWACRRPVVGLRTRQSASVIDHERDGLLAADGPDVTRQVRRLLEDPAEAAAMGEAGQEKVDARYTWSRLVDKTLGVYRSVM